MLRYEFCPVFSLDHQFCEFFSPLIVTLKKNKAQKTVGYLTSINRSGYLNGWRSDIALSMKGLCFGLNGEYSFSLSLPVQRDT